MRRFISLIATIARDSSRQNDWWKMRGWNRANARRISQTGFTAIELLVVIVIFLILLSISIPYALNLRESSRRTQCASNLRQLRDALHYYASADVSHIYPRVMAQENVAGYTAFTGADDANPFAPGS